MLSLLPAFHCFSNVTNSRFSGADRRMSACHCCAAFTDRGALLDLPHKGLNVSQMCEVEVPCKIYGDIHGQLRDLLLLLPPQTAIKD